MKLTPAQIAKIESVLSMYERGCTRPEIMLAYGIRDRAYVSAFRSFMCALGVDVPTYWMPLPPSESIDPVDRTYAHDFTSTSLGDTSASRFRSASELAGGHAKRVALGHSHPPRQVGGQERPGINSRFRSASTGPQGRVPSAPMTAPAPAVGVGAFSGDAS